MRSKGLLMNIINILRELFSVIRDFIMLPLAWSVRHLYGLVQGSLHCATQQGLAIYEIQTYP